MTRYFKSHSSRLLGSVCIGAISIAVAPSAVAQVDEIVVTAEKRAENVQDVSLSVTALDANALDKGGVYDVTRISALIPGVNFAFIGNDAKINVRGANANNTFGDNAAIVGVFADGVYKPRASQQTRQFYDIERLEFLRGPQGTLYGRNTFAGAINLYTNKPNFDGYSAGVDVSYSRFNTLRVEGFANLPVNETLALRVAAFKKDSDGYVENLAGRNLGADDKLGIRIAALWEPSDAANFLLRYSYSDEGGTALGVFSYTGSCRPVDVDGLTDPAGGLVDCNNARRGGVGSTPWNVLGPYQVEHDFVNESDLAEHNVTLEGNFDLGAVTLKSISSFTDYMSLIGLDGDSGPAPFERFWFEEDAQSYTQELQLASDYESRLQWTAGAYYSHDKTFFSFSDFRQTVDDGSGVGSVTAIDGNGNPIIVPFLVATPLVSLNTSLNGHFVDATQVKSDYFGIYAQGEFSLAESLRIIGGVRYNNEDKSVLGGSNFSAVPPVTIRPGFGSGASPLIVPSTPGEVFVYDLTAPGIAGSQRKYDNVSWRAGAEFDVNEDVLLYGTVATGFLSGSVNANGNNTDEQKSKVYELGMKSRFFDNTVQLNVAGHVTRYTNLLAQLQTVDPNTGNIGTTTRNGGLIKAKGVEVELVYAPNEALTLSANLAYLDSEYGEFGFGNLYQAYSGPLPVIGGTPVTINGRPTILGGVIQLEGERTPWSPKFTANLNGSYEFDLGANGTITPSVQFYYSDDYNVAGNLPNDPTGNQDSYTKTDLRLAWASQEGNYGVEAYVENLENEAVNARLNVGGNDHAQTSYLYPRNYGVRVKARF